MAAMKLDASTHHSLILRLTLSLLVGLPVTGLALLHLGWASPLGLVFAVPAGYLLQAAVKDGAALARSTPSVERPRFIWFLLGGALCLAYWAQHVLGVSPSGVL
jgi:hypothetical protein